MSVVVETVLLGLHCGRLTYRASRQSLGDDDHPDAAARRLAGFAPAGGDDGRVLHSTSWRFADGRIVLTYAALPDPDPGTATVLDAPAAPARGADPLTPAPARVEQADVVVHACRHLAFLHRTDPVVAEAAGRHVELWAAVDAHRPAVAGLLQLTAR